MSDQIMPVGYKQTEVGVIPTDWDVSRRENIIQNVIDNRGKTPPLATRGFPLIEVNAIYKQGKHPNLSLVSKFVNKSTYENWFRKGHPNKGTILIVTVGSAGESSIIQNPIGCIAQNIIGLNIKDSYDNNFVFYYTKTNKFKKDVKAVLMGAVQPSLKVPHIFNFQIPLPPTLEEQTRIATVLSDIDELITQMDELIAKKKAIKQGAMQLLLTPKDDWEVKKLGEIADFYTGLNVPNERNGSYINLTMGSVSVDGKLIHSLKTNHTEKILKKGQLVMPTRDVGMGYVIGRTALIDKDNTYFAGNCLYVLDLKNVNSEFINHVINCNNTRDKLKAIVSGGSQKQITLTDIKAITLIMPPYVEEQVRIATTLSDIDNEIQQLEQKKAKYEQIKQGAMQQLLAGKIRLV